MSGDRRSYAQRRIDRLERIRRRVDFLGRLIERNPDYRREIMERSALLWVIEEVALLDTVAETLQATDVDDAEKLARLSSLCRSRLRPTASDLERTPGLARQQSRGFPDSFVEEARRLMFLRGPLPVAGVLEDVDTDQQRGHGETAAVGGPD